MFKKEFYKPMILIKHCFVLMIAMLLHSKIFSLTSTTATQGSMLDTSRKMELSKQEWLASELYSASLIECTLRCRLQGCEVFAFNMKLTQCCLLFDQQQSQTENLEKHISTNEINSVFVDADWLNYELVKIKEAMEILQSENNFETVVNTNISTSNQEGFSKMKVKPTEAKSTKVKPTETKSTKVKPTETKSCLLYTSPSPRDGLLSRMPSSA